MDRNRQDWLSKGCDHKQVLNESVCSLYNVPQRAEEEKNLFNADSVKEHRSPERNGATFDDPKQESRITNDVNPGRDNVSIGVPGVITILFIVGLVAALGMWVLYAYRNPHSASGQILIRVSSAANGGLYFCNLFAFNAAWKRLPLFIRGSYGTGLSGFVCDGFGLFCSTDRVSGVGGGARRVTRPRRSTCDEHHFRRSAV